MTNRPTVALLPTHPISCRLAEMRVNHGLTQKELAFKSGVGEKTISSFETGERIGSVKLTQIVAICSALGVTISDFFAGLNVDVAHLGRSPRLAHICDCEAHVCSAAAPVGLRFCESCRLGFCGVAS